MKRPSGSVMNYVFISVYTQAKHVASLALSLLASFVRSTDSNSNAPLQFFPSCSPCAALCFK